VWTSLCFTNCKSKALKFSESDWDNSHSVEVRDCEMTEGVLIELNDVFMIADCCYIIFRYCRYLKLWATDGWVDIWMSI